MFDSFTPKELAQGALVLLIAVALFVAFNYRDEIRLLFGG